MHTDVPADSHVQPPDLRLSSWKLNAGRLPVLALLSGTARDFYRRAAWAPDGSCILATTESQGVHILRLDQGGAALIRESTTLSPSPLLEAIWYPVPTDTASWCFVESHRDLPVRLTNSADMSSMASYSIMNHVEKYVAPHSLALSPDLSRLYCGLWSALAVIPLSQPGLNTHSSIPLTAKKNSSSGQKGVVSALATATHPTDPESELVAVGTYFGSVGIYAIRPTLLPAPADHTANARLDPHARDLAQKSCLAGWREIDGEGITQLRFHPLTPYVLFVASRKSSYIYAYDLRYLFGSTNRWKFPPQTQPGGGLRSGPLLARFSRPASDTHQRLSFDIDWAGRLLVSGDQHGDLRLWNIHGGRFTDERADTDEEDDHKLDMEPELHWKAHDGKC